VQIYFYLKKDEDDDWETDEPKAESSKKRSDTTKKKSTNSETPTKAKKAATMKPVRNSWVEYWNEEDEQWIGLLSCTNSTIGLFSAIDPLHAVVDQSKQIEADVSKPMHYVLAVENGQIALSPLDNSSKIVCRRGNPRSDQSLRVKLLVGGDETFAHGSRLVGEDAETIHVWTKQTAHSSRRHAAAQYAC
jgi:hypothetical protein